MFYSGALDLEVRPGPWIDFFGFRFTLEPMHALESLSILDFLKVELLV